MKTLAVIFAASVLMIPVSAQAGHYKSNCGASATMSVTCERGVPVYRVKPLQYAPGQLAALARADELKAQQRKLKRKLAMKSRTIREQRKDISGLERRLDKLESRRSRRGYGGQSIVGVGFGDNFLSPQRTPGLNNGFFSGRRNSGGRRRGGGGRHHK